MTQTIFDVCTPRPDVLAGNVSESDFAADLAQVLRGAGAEDYKDAAKFFENTYPTRGLKNLLANVCRRLSGAGGEAASIFRLDTQFGGGKTHGLIALVHAARGASAVPNIAEFVEPGILPSGKVRIAAFDGENADPANGRTMGDGVRAYSPWGEIAYALAMKDGYERVRASDEQRVAPGADTMRELFGDEPVLILLDELSVYLRKTKNIPGARDQLSAFLTSLFKAVESTPNAALVYTLAIGKEGKAGDAYGDENEFIAERMAEVESISARKATLLNPTEDDETAQVLRRRLFSRIDDAKAAVVIEAYRALWKQNEGVLSQDARRPETVELFAASYPLHPEVLDTLSEKVATLSNFQRVRGMLRLLARTVAHLWAERPADAHAIHLHHMDVGYEPIRQEFITRLGLTQYSPALRRDVASDGSNQAVAQQIDADHYRGLPPYTSYVARTIFLHSVAFNDQVRGIGAEQLRFSIIGPGADVGFIDDARKRFMEESAFLDDRPGVPLRFLVEANLTQVVRRQEQLVDAEDIRANLRDRIRHIFSRHGDAKFDLIAFPGGAYDVPDEIGENRPLLIVLSYEAVPIAADLDRVPHLIERIYNHKGADDKALRLNRNGMVFLAAEQARIDEIRRKMARHLALQELKKAERVGELAEHQQAKIREDASKSEQGVAIAIQQCYRHVFYPSRTNRLTDDVNLSHTTVDIPSASASPGAGQRHVERVLRDSNKLRVTGDAPDSPTYIRDRTPLKKGEITTRSLREEFRRDPALPMLVGDDVFITGIRQGVERGEYVYRRGELLYGEGDPQTTIFVDEQSTVFTMPFARERGIWPRPVAPPPAPPPPAPVERSERGMGGTSAPTPVPVTPPEGDLVTAQGVLKEALAQLWDKCRARKLTRVHLVKIRMFEASDAFKLLGVAGSVQGAKKTVRLSGGYETTDGGALEFQYTGPSTDAQAVKEFLEPQLRAAAAKSLKAELELDFDDGLLMTSDAPEKLIEKLGKYASGAAYVTATAETRAGAPQ